MTETRVVNVHYSTCDVRIDRRTVLGNPYRIGPDGNRATVIQKHMTDWRAMLADEETREAPLLWLQFVKGKRLGCHCKPAACHGDNYLALIAEFCP